ILWCSNPVAYSSSRAWHEVEQEPSSASSTARRSRWSSATTSGSGLARVQTSADGYSWRWAKGRSTLKCWSKRRRMRRSASFAPSARLSVLLQTERWTGSGSLMSSPTTNEQERTRYASPPRLAHRISESLTASYGTPSRESLPLNNKPDPLDELIYILLTVMTE